MVMRVEVSQLIGRAFQTSGRGSTRLPWVDHIDAVFKSDINDSILGEVGSDGGHALADLVRFVGLGYRNSVD